jgi:hypothetical protein
MIEVIVIINLGGMMKKIFENKPRLFFGIGFLFVAILTITGLLIGGKYITPDKVGGDVIALVGGEKITKSDLNARIFGMSNFEGSVDNPPNIGDDEKKDLLKELIEWKIIEDEAKKKNISVTKDELNSYILENVENYEQMDGDVKKVVDDYQYHKLLINKLEERLTTQASGKYLIARFDRQIESDATKNDQEAINKDKEYAKTLVDSIWDRLNSKQINFDQAIQIINNDRTIGKPAFGTSETIMSGEFSSYEFQYKDEIFVYEEAVNEVNKLTKGDFTKPFVVNGYDTLDENGSEKMSKIEVGYAIVFAENLEKGEYSSYSDLINDRLADVEIIIYDSFYKEFENKLSVQKSSGVANAISRPWTSTRETKLGVTTGRSTSTAGMVVGFFKETAAGDSWISSTNFKMSRSAKSGSAGDSIVRWGSGPTCNDEPKVFTLGSAIYTGPLTHANRCTQPGTLPSSFSQRGVVVLGWGSTDSNGNGYSLDCDWNYTIDYRTGQSGFAGVANPSIDTNHETAVWQHSSNHYPWSSNVSWSNNAGKQLTVGVTNGATRKIFFKYKVTWSNARPTVEPTSTSANINAPTTFDLGSSSLIYLNAKALDSNNDQVKYRIAYKKSTDGGASWGSFVYVPGASTWTSLSNQNTDRTVKSYLPSELGVGLYYWVVTAADEHGLQNANRYPTTNPNNPYNHDAPRYFAITSNNPPVPTVENPGNQTITSGTTKAVILRGKSNDPDGDKGRVQVMYKKSTDSTWTSFGTSNGAEDPNGARTATANGIKNDKINQWGWSCNTSPAPAGSADGSAATDCWANNNTWIEYPSINLTAGTYQVAARAIDIKLKYGITWHTQTFTVSQPCSLSTFTADRTSGEAPLTVRFSFGTPTNATSYDIAYGNGVKSAPRPASPNTYTYNTPGTYIATLSCLSPLSSLTQTITVSGTNRPPQVSLIEPADGQTITTDGTGVANIELKSNITDPDNDQVAIFNLYQKKNTDGTWPATWNVKPDPEEIPWSYQNQPYNSNWPVSLDSGQYRWHAQGFDDKGAEDISEVIYFTVTDPALPVRLDCSVEPITGDVPLGVEVTPDPTGITTPSYDYDFTWDGINFNPQISGVTTKGYHSYEVAGTYRVRVREVSTNTYATCTPDPVIVKDPSSGDDREVRP